MQSPSTPEPAIRAGLAFSWADLWSRPGAQLAEAARRGEIFVARLRLVLVFVVCAIPLAAYLSRPVLQNRIGLIAAVAALFIALLLFSIARWTFFSGLGFVSSLIDVSLVSSVLLT